MSRALHDVSGLFPVIARERTTGPFNPHPTIKETSTISAGHCIGKSTDE